jgi:hypothetical protein
MLERVGVDHHPMDSKVEYFAEISPYELVHDRLTRSRPALQSKPASGANLHGVRPLKSLKFPSSLPGEKGNMQDLTPNEMFLPFVH